MSIQLPDTPTADSGLIRIVAFDDNPPFGAGSFVMAECPSGRQFFGMISGPNRNLNRNSMLPHDNTQVNQLEQILAGRMQRDVAIREVYYYEATLLTEVVNNIPASVRIRPQTGSAIRHAMPDEIMRFLGMPEIRQETEIGKLIGTDITVSIDALRLLCHMLIAGTTGSGKSNTIGNVAQAALSLGWSTVILDHKPDYQDAHEANDEQPAMPHYAPLGVDRTYWYIGEAMPTPGRREQRVSVAAADLSPTLLAATMFPFEPSEHFQQESFLTLLEAFIDNRAGQPWTLRVDFANWLANQTPNMAPQTQDRVLEAIKRKFPRRIPSWVEAVQAQPPQGGGILAGRARPIPIANFNLNGIQPRHATIIRIGGDAGRDYGLLLSYILGRLDREAAAQRLPCRVLVVIDEAQDIFSGGQSLRSAIEGNLNRHIRKGRSLGIGYVIGVQSADAVPDQIMNNLNSRIIHTHKSPDQLRKASARIDEAQRQLALTLRPGEALFDCHGASGLAHCQMRRSPFKLTKEDV